MAAVPPRSRCALMSPLCLIGRAVRAGRGGIEAGGDVLFPAAASRTRSVLQVILVADIDRPAPFRGVPSGR